MRDCDFIPADYRETGQLRRAIKLRASCVGGLIAMMVLWTIAHHHRLAAAEAMLPEIESQQRDISFNMAAKAKMETRRASLLGNQELLRLLENRASLVVLFADVSRSVPDTVVVTELSVRCPSIAKYSVTEQDPAAPQQPSQLSAKDRPAASAKEEVVEDSSAAVLFIRGIAVANPEVVSFAAALENSPLLDRVQTEAKGPVVWGGRQAEQFELRCELVEQTGDAP